MSNRRFLFVICGALWSLPSLANQKAPNTWLDETHQDTTRLLGNTVHRIDDWFGTTNPDRPAKASLRVMMDIHHNEHDGTKIKPRIRGKVKLPTLEHRLSVIIGDDDLDNEQGGGIYNDERLKPDSQHTFNREQSRKDNASLALRWSKFKEHVGVDADIGLRSDDIYVRLQAQKTWQTKHLDGRAEQTYRYGSRSEHFALSTLEFSQPQSQYRTLYNRSHIIYTHKGDEEKTGWSNSLYQQHTWQGKHGNRLFSYGMYAGGDIADKNPTLNTYGPYISYRQPVWRNWLFVQTDVSYYNNKNEHKEHFVSTFGRLEVVF